MHHPWVGAPVEECTFHRMRRPYLAALLPDNRPAEAVAVAWKTWTGVQLAHVKKQQLLQSAHLSLDLNGSCVPVVSRT